MPFTRIVRALAPALLLATLAPSAGAADDATTRLYDHSLRRLHADESVRLADRYAGQPVLVVNTASHCGFTRQLRELEAVHQRFKERGLKVAGFPSDDFRQEAADEAETAEVCFQNFGVTFDMYAPIRVTGAEAHPLFREIARQSAAPDWNFHKYVIDRNGRVVASFGSRTKPDAPEVIAAIEKAL
ncbi:MAG: redoxin domain-containing protein [Thauera sp.]|nr:redoxin domain-containing protein [Thauera sp.]